MSYKVNVTEKELKYVGFNSDYGPLTEKMTLLEVVLCRSIKKLSNVRCVGTESNKDYGNFRFPEIIVANRKKAGKTNIVIGDGPTIKNQKIIDMLY